MQRGGEGRVLLPRVESIVSRAPLSTLVRLSPVAQAHGQQSTRASQLG